MSARKTSLQKVAIFSNIFGVLAFWDKTEKSETLVLATNGFIKKTAKTPKSEIERAERIRKEYFNNKNKNRR